MNKQVGQPKVIHNGWAKKKINSFQQKCIVLGGEDYKAMVMQEEPVTELPISRILTGNPSPSDQKKLPNKKRKKPRVVELPPEKPVVQPKKDNMTLINNMENEFMKKQRIEGPTGPMPPLFPSAPVNTIREIDPRTSGKSGWIMALGAASLLSKFFV